MRVLTDASSERSESRIALLPRSPAQQPEVDAARIGGCCQCQSARRSLRTRHPPIREQQREDRQVSSLGLCALCRLVSAWVLGSSARS